MLVTGATTPISKFLSLRLPAIDQNDQLSFLRQHDQLAFIRALTPFFQTAYELGELHNFYEMVLMMWFDVWPELSQNPLTQQHNRFDILMRVTIEVIRSYFGTATTEEWTTAVAFPGQAKKMDYEYVASMTGIWDALSPGAQAALKHIGENCFKKGLVKKANFFDPNEKSDEGTKVVEKLSDTTATQIPESSEQSDDVTRIEFKAPDSDGDLRRVMATIFEREEGPINGDANLNSSILAHSGHDDYDLKDYDWESISACSSKGEPLSKEEIHEIFGGMSPLDIFGPDVDPFEGEDFRYQGRSLRRVRLTKLKL